LCSKHDLLVDGNGLPLVWTLTGADHNDVTQLLELLDRVPPVRSRIGRPRLRPPTLTAAATTTSTVASSGNEPRPTAVVERTLAWLQNHRRLLVRTDRRDKIHKASSP
jgi:hypothetical protein